MSLFGRRPAFNRIEQAANFLNGINIKVDVTDIQPGNPGIVSLAVTATEGGTNKPLRHVAVSFFINGTFALATRLDTHGRITQDIRLPAQSGTYHITAGLGELHRMQRIFRIPQTTITIMQNTMSIDTIDEITNKSLFVPVTITRKATGKQLQVVSPATVLIPYISQEDYAISVPDTLQASSEYANGMGLDAPTSTLTQTIIEDIRTVLGYLPFHLIHVDNPFNAPYDLSAGAAVRLNKITSNEYAALHGGTITMTSTGPTMPPVDNAIYSQGWIIDGVENDAVTTQARLVADTRIQPVAFKWIGNAINDIILSDWVSVNTAATVQISGGQAVVGSAVPLDTMGLAKSYDMSLVDRHVPFTVSYLMNWAGSDCCIAIIDGNMALDVIDNATGRILFSDTNIVNGTIKGSVNIMQYAASASSITIRARTRACIQGVGMVE